MRLYAILALAGGLVVSSTGAVAARRSRPHHAGVPRPVAPLARDGNPNIQAAAAAVVDLNGHGDYFVKNPDAVQPIASISKLMAVLVVLDHGLDLDGVTVISGEDKKVAWKGARSRLLEGMRVTNRDLLHAALIASDNRAVPALGRAVKLGPTELAAAMTKKARALGLYHTDFKDPTGLDDGNVSTPRETIRMLRVALDNPTMAEILRKPNFVVHPVGRGGAIEYSNTDMLVRTGRWIILGGKTGYTDIARYCLVVAAKVGEREVAMAFLGAEGKLTRFGDFTRTADWLLARKDVAPSPPKSATAAASPSPAQAAPSR
jgi:D-alanyl-D-alanine endopeptidase (penicillin-binding protein 7)